MCGIAGFAVPAGRPVPGDHVLAAMTRALAHRGPDGEELLPDGNVGLGHRRLAIIDVAGGDNPLLDPAGHAALVFNGEIYNHRELRDELLAAGCRPRTRSDGEVILHGYLVWGLLGMLRRLRGMYAFALLDRRDRSLHLARDPLGIKPLFVARSPRALLFGSEIKALLPGMASRPPLSSRALLQCASLGYVLSPLTMYEGVESLPPGSCLSWRDGRIEQRRHHELVFEPGAEPADPEALWQRLSDAVASHLMSEVPLGAFLSGGVDSSAVVAAMAGRAQGGVDAISVGILDDGLDERPFAREVAAGLPVRLHEEEVRDDVAALLPRLAHHLEQPFADTSAAPTFLLCEAARRHVTVALSGDGGDESFAGYRRTRYDVLEERLRAVLPGWLRRSVLSPLGAAWPRHPRLPRPLRAGTLLGNLGGDWVDGWLTSLCRVPEARARALLHPDRRSDVPLRADVEHHARRVAGLDPLSRVLAMDFATWLPDDILVKVDRTSMAHGLEVRVPLLDTDFVEYAARLPVAAKLAGGQGKRLLKQALRGRVPDAVLDRGKQGFHLPVGGWLAGPLAPRLSALLADEHAPAWELLDRPAWLATAAAHGRGRAERAAELWFLLALDAFLSHGPGGSAT